MADSKKKARKGTGRVAFKAHLAGIKKMIEDGHPVIAVFEAYENKLSIKSGQFGKYVRQYVKGEQRKKTKPVTIEPETKEKELSTSEYLRTRPNKKDLLNG